MIGSPIRTVSKYQAALSGLRLMQPWLTFELPCDPTDHGALCTYTPPHVTRTASATVSLYPSGSLSGIPIVRESITTLFSFASAVNEPTGVGCLGLPIEAGI